MIATEKTQILTETLEFINAETITGRDGWVMIGEFVDGLIWDREGIQDTATYAWARRWQNAKNQSGKRDTAECLDELRVALETDLGLSEVADAVEEIIERRVDGAPVNVMRTAADFNFRLTRRCDMCGQDNGSKLAGGFGRSMLQNFCPGCHAKRTQTRQPMGVALC